MKRVLFLIASVAVLTSASRDPKADYIALYSATAISEMQRTGVPASITMAQAVLESRSGESPLATKANNHFGIKCHKDWEGKAFYQDDDSKNECFRVYSSPEDSFRDHSDFLRGRDRYSALFELSPTDYKAWARGLRRAGYATDPQYATKLIKIIEDYRLYDLDGVVEAPATVAPAAASAAVPVASPSASQSSASSIIKEHLSYPISRTERDSLGVHFIRSIEGESYETIAAAHNIKLKKLLKFNKLEINETLVPGTVVYLEKQREPRKAREKKEENL